MRRGRTWLWVVLGAAAGGCLETVTADDAPDAHYVVVDASPVRRDSTTRPPRDATLGRDTAPDPRPDAERPADMEPADSAVRRDAAGRDAAERSDGAHPSDARAPDGRLPDALVARDAAIDRRDATPDAQAALDQGDPADLGGEPADGAVRPADAAPIEPHPDAGPDPRPDVAGDPPLRDAATEGDAVADAAAPLFDAGAAPDAARPPPRDATPPDAAVVLPADAGPALDAAVALDAARDAAIAVDAAPVDAAPAVDAASDPEEGPIVDLAPHLALDWAAVHRLRAVFDARSTHPCEIQIVGDSISETYLFLNPLTTDPTLPDMAFAGPAHCRLFGQPSIFLDVHLTAASGTTAEWGLLGVDGWGGVVNLRYPMPYIDRDRHRDPVGPRQAWPEIATILFGTNDVRRYYGDRYSWDRSPEGEAEERAEYVRHLRGIAAWFLDRGVVPVLVTFPPGTYDAYEFAPQGAGWGERAGRPLGETWAQAVRDLGAELQVPVLDIQAAFLERADWPDLLPDGVHPDARGYNEVVNPLFHAAYQDLRRLVLRR